MPTISHIIHEIEEFAPPIYQEPYDNARLITGNKDWDCTGALLSLDCTEAIVDEAIEKGCNLIVAHHPIVFTGLKSLTGKNYVERTVIKAIKNDIALYASHTNLDNMWHGVNKKIAEKIGLKNTRVLKPKQQTLSQLQTFVPVEHADTVRKALFAAGAGEIGNYSSCSFNSEGNGTFLGNDEAQPTYGKKGSLQTERETKIEVILPVHLQQSVVAALKKAHPYEEVAYYVVPLNNVNQEIGSGLIGELEQPMHEQAFLQHIKTVFNCDCLRHTQLLNKQVNTVAVCGGVGSFLLPNAIAKNADVYVSADFKYHEFFDADGNIVIADIGHFESEQFTPEIFHEIITKKYGNFAVHFSELKTNPIKTL